MSSASAIEWTDATWNPVTGCDRVSPGCAHCYALELAPRLRRFARARGTGKWLDVPDGGKASGPAFGVTLHESELHVPLRWRKPRRVFVNSMSDLFHEAIEDEVLAYIFAVMALAPDHTFQVLTKRPDRMVEFLTRELEPDVGWLPGTYAQALIGQAIGNIGPDLLRDERSWALYDDPNSLPWPIPNVWLGVTIENRRFVDRADLLRDTPAAVRFISAEPLLGPLVTPEWKRQDYPIREGRPRGVVQTMYRPGLDLTGIDWLIVGGESGPEHRPMKLEWARDLRDACQRDHDDIIGMRSAGRFPRWDLHGTAFFFKQHGGHTPKAGGRELDRRTWDEFPIRSFELPQKGDAATTTVEARGCPDPRPGRRARIQEGSVGRAAGALLTGQRQDGQSQVPAREQDPRAVHGGAGPLRNRTAAS